MAALVWNRKNQGAGWDVMCAVWLWQVVVPASRSSCNYVAVDVVV